MKSIVNTVIAALFLSVSMFASGEERPEQKRREETPKAPTTPPAQSKFDEKDREELIKKLRNAEPLSDGEKARKESNEKLIALLGKSDSMELFRLDPKVLKPADNPKKQESEFFHDFHIVLQTTVGTADQRKELVTSLGKELHWAEGLRGQCFIPHHGLRAVIGKDTYDFVICLMCNQMRIYKGDELLGDTILLGPKWEVADKLLKEAEDKKEKRK